MNNSNENLAYYERGNSYIYSYDKSILMPEVPIHLHNSYEIYYFLSGNVTYYIEGQSYELETNDVLIINNKELHRPVFNSDDPYERIVIHFSPNIIFPYRKVDYNPLYAFEKKKSGKNNLIKGSSGETSKLYNILKNMIDFTQEKSCENDLMLDCLLLQLCIEINKLTKDSIKNTKSNDDFNTDSRVINIINYINNNLSKEITLDELSTNFYLSKSYMCNLFKSYTRFSILEYVASKRIIKAKELLLQGISSTETCHQCGFKDYSNFYKTFVKLVGMSPRDFKEENK